ncbi:hypothetical protein RhiirA5_416714 [Rhizophagus irregularis]|uniref:Uncharacterized protein n=1 Tax=Rhizophagus irregularis TaxID=588596 RepID=A0A2N0S5B1_9GLOM|nr:hypothetical protein RhiirA5_416714 [Rhizophagus irregularis]PKC70736.1 hypothetical protein RhiirA1_454399 [Rhizophagus irregularis]
MLALPYTYIIEYTEFKGMVYSMEPTVLFGRAFQSRTHSQRESTSNFTGITVDWNIARSLYSINLYELEVTAFSSGYFLGNANWMIDCGGEKSIITQYLWTIIELRGIPFYAVSPIAEESLKYSNICGKWAGSSLQEKYQEPCVVFVGRPSLRSSAAINFIREWEIIQIIQRYLQVCLQIYLPINILLTVNKVTNTLKEKRSQNVLVSSKEIRVILDEFEENKGEFKL